MVSRVVISDSLRGKAIHASALRRKSSSKATGSTSILLAIGSAGLMFADGGIDRHQRCQALQGGIDLFNGVLGAESLLVKGQGVEVSTFGGGSKTFLVDICSYLGTKDLRGAFSQSCRQGRPRPRRGGVKLRGGFKLLFGARRGRDNPFILVNNIVADFADHCNGFHFS